MKGFVMLIMGILLVIIAVWIGISIYDASNDVEINPNAEQHLKPIKPEFDLESVEKVTERIGTLLISPEVFHLLDEQTNADLILEENGIDTGDE